MVVGTNDTNARRQYFNVDLSGRPKNGGLISYTITFRVAKVSDHSPVLRT
jgi:hypothetical protein